MNPMLRAASTATRAGESLNLLAFIASLAIACGTRDEPVPNGASAPSSPSVVQPAAINARGKQIALLQAQAGPEYLPRAVAGRLLASHPRMKFETSFEPNRVTSAGVELALTKQGCPSDMKPVASALPVVTHGSSSRVEYDHGSGLVEWYVHGPLGLEQGFTLAQLPACARGEKKLVLGLASNQHHHVALSADGAYATLTTSSGQRVLYGQAYAEDARGRALPLRLQAAGSLTLEIDVSDAVAPIYVDPLLWIQQDELIPSLDLQKDTSPASIDISGDTAIVGSYRNVLHDYTPGAAYIFVRSGAGWAETQILKPSDNTGDGAFGTAVAIDGNTALVGDSRRSVAYVFVRSGATFAEQKILTGSLGGAEFGRAVALSGNTALIDTADGPYIFTRTGSVWSQDTRLDLPSYGGGIAVSGDTVLIGEPGVANSAGAAEVFRRSGLSWVSEGLLASASGDSYYYQGTSVALDGDTALVGAPGVQGNGAAYVFTRSGSTWTERATLGGQTGSQDQFGSSAALDGGLALVGTAVINSPYATHDRNAFHVFAGAGASWSEQQRVLPDDGFAGDGFATAIAISGHTALATMLGDIPLGSTRVFALDTGNGCSSGDQCSSGNCVEGVCCDLPCAGVCQSCLAAVKGSGVDGKCGPIALNTDPKNGCATTGASTCGSTGACNGAGACTLHAAGVQCVAASCPTTTSENPADQCNGSGSCVASAAVACKRGYLCKAGACRTTCSTSADCDAGPGFQCIGGKCAVPQGGGCSLDADCATAHCTDGVCCDSECDQKCNSCLASEKGSGSDGVCEPIAADTDPKQECAASSDACQADGFCDGEGSCRSFAKPQTPCKAAACDPNDSSKLDPADACDGAGNCSDSVPVSCQRGYLCSNDVCLTGCVTSADCDASQGFECLDSKCKIKQAGACSGDSDCETGHCSDGVCCDQKCDQKCNSCLANAKISGPDGECGPLPADTDPADECEEDADPCQADGKCDGEGSCRAFAKPQKECGTTMCEDNVVTGRLCDGQGSCGNDSVSCAPYICASTACNQACQTDDDCHPTSDPDAYVGAFCNGFGQCQDKLSDGDSCGKASECASGYCADGFCCNQACTGQCEACGEAGAEGKCVAVQGEPRSQREQCAEAPAGEPCLASGCDGKTTDSCAGFAGSAVVCQQPSCQDGRATGKARCDGKGNCSVDPPVDCGAFRCGASECLTECADNADCVAGNLCVDGECGLAARCSDDLLSVIDAQGVQTSCGAYHCLAGACLKTCSTSVDCAAGFVCNSESQQCQAASASAADDAGCGCRGVGRASGGSVSLLAALALLIGQRRRRRRR